MAKLKGPPPANEIVTVNDPLAVQILKSIGYTDAPTSLPASAFQSPSAGGTAINAAHAGGPKKVQPSAMTPGAPLPVKSASGAKITGSAAVQPSEFGNGGNYDRATGDTTNAVAPGAPPAPPATPPTTQVANTNDTSSTSTAKSKAVGVRDIKNGLIDDSKAVGVRDIKDGIPSVDDSQGQADKKKPKAPRDWQQMISSKILGSNNQGYVSDKDLRNTYNGMLSMMKKDGMSQEQAQEAARAELQKFQDAVSGQGRYVRYAPGLNVNFNAAGDTSRPIGDVGGQNWNNKAATPANASYASSPTAAGANLAQNALLSPPEESEQPPTRPVGPVDANGIFSKGGYVTKPKKSVLAALRQFKYGD